MTSISRRDFVKASGLALAGAGMGVPRFGAQAAQESRDLPERPNVLLIMTDQQSADALSCRMGKVGRNYLHTPNMDRLFAEGVGFERAYCPNPLCAPSRTSMLTGRFPHEVGIQENGLPLSSRDYVRNLDMPCLGVAFRDAGYNTGYLGKIHNVHGTFDFNDVDDEDIDHGFEYTANMGHNGIDDDMLDPAKDFLEKQQNEDSPFFLVASYNNPHNICEWARGTRGDKLPDGAVEDPDLADCPPLRTNHLPPEDEPRIMSFMRRSYSATGMSPVYDHTEADWRKHQWGYYKMTEIVDRHIGDLLQALRDSGQEENTLVVFLSDHGDMQGAHEWNQKWVFYDEASRVPMAFHWPGVINPGTRYQLVHTGVDLIPTLCGLTGVKRPPDLPGTDLTETIMQDKPKGRDFLVCSNYLEAGAEVGGVRRTPSGRMVRGERFKYCVYDTGEASEELYDMVNDPGEMKNLAHNSDYEDVVRQYRGYLEEFRQKYNDDEFQPFYETS